MYKIMIVEDDMTIAKTVANHLRKWDYEVEYVTDFKNVFQEFTKWEPHLVIMDITLPFFNGYYWCAKIREVSKVPIVFLSSMSDNMNIVMAINMGGDEFIEKPFDLHVMTAKIQGLLRRSYAFRGEVHLLERGGAILNVNDATLTYEGRKLSLTKNDYRILKLLMEHAGKIVSREEIMTRLWESDEFIDDNTLTVNVNRLRKKLEEMGLTDFIVTKKGIGYSIP